MVESVLIAIIIVIVGLVAVLSEKRGQGYIYLLFITLMGAVGFYKGPLYLILFLATNIPILFCLRKSSHLSNKEIPSTLLEKMTTYISLGAMFGFYLLNKDIIHESMRTSTLDRSTLITLEWFFIISSIMTVLIIFRGRKWKL